jgi:nicotinamide-nucleotide amidase
MSLIDELSLELAACLREQQLTITTAESCTGGGIAQAITDVPGSSQWFSHGFVTYSNTAKQQLINVPPSLIQNHGAVSQEVVEAMAAGALNIASSDLAIAVSGVAGPGGGTPKKPVGTVWIAWLRQNQPVTSQIFLFSGDRKNIRNQALVESFRGLLKLSQKTTV